jgi:hypothetical protein
MTQLEELIMMVAERDTATAKNEMLSEAIRYNTLAVEADKLAKALTTVSKKFSAMGDVLNELRGMVDESNSKEACKVAFLAEEHIEEMSEKYFGQHTDSFLCKLDYFNNNCDVEKFSTESREALKAGDNKDEK